MTAEDLSGSSQSARQDLKWVVQHHIDHRHHLMVWAKVYIIYVYAWIYIYVYIDHIYIYMYVYIYMYTYMHIYICDLLLPESAPNNHVHILEGREDRRIDVEAFKVCDHPGVCEV